MSNADFLVYADGIVLLRPNTKEAEEWIAENVYLEDVTTMGLAVPMNMDCAEAICLGILEDGLIIEKDGMEMYVEDGELLLRESEAIAA